MNIMKHLLAALVLFSGQLVVPDKQATQVKIQEQGDYELVKKHVEEHIFRNKTAVSIGVLHSLHRIRINGSSYRHKLKQRLIRISQNVFCLYQRERNRRSKC